MRFVEEVVVDEFLPTFRSMLAAELRERGLTQHEVAELLGISQSAVSKYAHGEVARRDVFLEDDRVREVVERIADGLGTGDMSRVQALVESEVLVRDLTVRGEPISDLHEAAMPALSEYAGDFGLHDPESPLRIRERTLSSVRRGLRVLEHTSGFVSLLPNVGSNLVECIPDAGGVEDVAGVPGRLLDVMGRVVVPAEPDYGVSEHVATVLLAAREGGSEARAGVNIRYEPDLVSALEARGHASVEFEPDDEEPAYDAVLTAIRQNPDATVLYQTGGFGVEPIIYLLGPTASDVAEVASELA
jgi:hypothetical protein